MREQSNTPERQLREVVALYVGLGLTGLALLTLGLGTQYGWPVAMIVDGVLFLTLATVGVIRLVLHR